MARSGAARASYTVAFGIAPKPAEPEHQTRVPRVTQMLALAHRVDEMIRTGGLRDLADAARSMGLTRARVTQILNLLLLAPEIQEAILDLPLVTAGQDQVSERWLRPIVAEPNWRKQISIWRQRHE